MSSRKPPRRPDNSLDPEGEFPLGAPDYFFYLLFQAQRQREAAFGIALAPCGLDMAEWRTLAIIRRLETSTMTQLARYSTVERTTLTRAVDQLVGRGLVGRAVPDSDRRLVHLTLTDYGEECYLQAVKIMLRLNSQVLEGVAQQDLRVATRILQTAVRRLAADESHAEDLLSFGRPGG